MKELSNNYKLANGVMIPKVGLGTWQIPNSQAYQVALDALKVGYHHIDTAQGYQNEVAIGQALKDSGLDRDSYFITSKLPSHIKGYKQTLGSFRKTMTDLQLDVLDLYLIHAPWPWNDIGKDCTQGNIESFKAMIDLYNQGKIRSIGVSNFNQQEIQALIDSTGVTPLVNQIRYYVGDTQPEIVAYCRKNNILVEAYSPLATGKLLKHPTLIQLAQKKAVSVAQLCIRYCLAKETLPLPKTTNINRMIENAQLDFDLSTQDIDLLDSLS